MAETRRPAMLIRFGAYEADLELRELRKHGLKIKVAEQPFQLLSELLEIPGEVVTRDQLQRKLWPSDTFVDFDRGLNKAMNRLRGALGDSADEPRYIETIPKRGYRFIAEIEPGQATFRTETQAVVSPPKPPARHTWPVVIGVLGALALLSSGVLAVYLRRPVPPQFFRSSLLSPPQTGFLPRNFALSLNGMQIAFVAIGRDGKTGLWVRNLTAGAAHHLEDTEDAMYPFWSPDGRRIGFFAAGKLKTVEPGSGAVQTVANAENPSGGAWNRDDVIVFAAGIGQPLYRVPAAGGQTAPVTHIIRGRTAQTASWPCFLPDGKRFLYSVQWAVAGEGLGTGLYVGSLDSTRDGLVSADISGNVIFALGHLLFVRDGKLLAQSFDPVRLELSGSPMALTQQELEKDTIYLQSGFSVSDAGDLVFESAPDFSSHLTWFDPSGRELGHIPQTGYRSPRLSPDGRKVAVSCDEAHDGKHSICVYDLERRVSTRITDGVLDSTPIWSLDGQEITYESRENEIAYLKSVRMDRSAPPRVLVEGGRLSPRGWLPDGRLVFAKVEGGGARVYLAAGRELTFLWPGSEAQVSPDGQWIAQASSAGTFVASVSEPRLRVQIANNGTQPRWSRDGRQLFYMAADRKLMAVGFDFKEGRALGPAHELFQTRIIGTRIAGIQYDVAADGRFLINSLPPDSSPLTLLTGWTALLRQ
jgi:eukaryotic-like serine/threonine-protein kinase